MSRFTAAIKVLFFCFFILMPGGGLNADAASIDPLLLQELATQGAEKLSIIVRLNDPFDAQTLAVSSN